MATTKEKTILVEAPNNLGINYLALYVLANSSVPLHARTFGTTYPWQLGS